MRPDDQANVRTPLNREAVVRAAVSLADENGVVALTMRKLATQLGVEAMSLYHHVANKEEILDGMVDVVFSEIEPISPERSWKTAMRERALSLRSVLRRHTWAVGLMDSRANPGMATLRHHESVIRCLRTAGFSIEMAAHAFSVMDSYIYGFVLQEVSLPFETAAELEEVVGAIMEQMPVAELPYFAEMIAGHQMKPDYSYSNEFEFGLDLVLDGLERMADLRG